MPTPIPVPDVKATADWYAALGFAITRADASSAHVALGRGEVAFTAGEAGEVDLFVSVENVEALHGRMTDLIDMAADLHDTEYGMRQFAIRDLNGLLITFGQPIAGRREPQL
jgi:catechol 2,3-dioxygenase-like lactoylglutathione lyase family enzyme